MKKIAKAQGTQFHTRNHSVTEGWRGGNNDDSGIISRLSRSASRNKGVKVQDYSKLNYNPLFEALGEDLNVKRQAQTNTTFNLYGKYGKKYRKDPSNK